MKKGTQWLSRFILLAGLMGIITVSEGQIWTGPKAGIQASRFFFADSEAQERYNEGIWLGWQVGGVSNFEVGGGWSLATDYAYSRKSHTHSAVFDTEIIKSYRSYFGFIDVSALLRYSFDETPRHYYLNIGPVMSYWTDGRGRIRTGLTDRLGFDNGYTYSMTFSDDPAVDIDRMYVRDANRFQLGIEGGIGMHADIFYGSRLQFDLRYQMGHTYLGTEASGEFGLSNLTFRDNLKGVHHMLSFSVAFLTSFEFNEIRDRNYLVK